MKKAKQNIEIIARALIRRGDSILLCKQIGRDYYFLPGGHVEFGESAEMALVREIKEELGAGLCDIKFIGAGENIFTQDGATHQEYNLVFSANLVSRGEIKSIEDHLEFCFVGRKDFAKMKIVPRSLQKAVLEWLRDKKPFWTSEGFQSPSQHQP